MKRLVLFLMLCAATGAGATSYTEFYCVPGGNNMYAGSTPDTTPTFTAINGCWTNNTSYGVFFKAALNPVAGGVTNGAWASVYPDVSTTNVFVGMVTNADDAADTITVSLTAKAGTAPATDEASTTTIVVGGAWLGPTTTNVTGGNSNLNIHPFNFAANTLTNESGNVPRFNFKGSCTVTQQIASANAGPMVFQGYTNIPGDGGYYTFNIGTTPSFTSANCDYKYMIFDGTSEVASGNGPNFGGNECLIYRCISRKCQRIGMTFSGNPVIAIECEAYSNNIANPALGHIEGINFSGAGLMIRCYSHDNQNSLGTGFGLSGINVQMMNCISANNVSNGVYASSAQVISMLGCDIYNNGGHGVDLSGAAQSLVGINSCNFFKNGGYGIHSSGSMIRNGEIGDCVFGSGTEANTLGTISTNLTAGIQGGVAIGRLISFAANGDPWVDAANANFSLASGTTNLASGAGTFLQTLVNAPTNTIGYPDIGAAQRASTNSSGGGEHSHVFMQ